METGDKHELQTPAYLNFNNDIMTLKKILKKSKKSLRLEVVGEKC